MIETKHKYLYLGIFTILFVALLYIFSENILTSIGDFLILNEKPVHSDAVVVLSTGMAYYPRLMEAAALYKKRLADKVVINGNRKTEILREIERKGFQPCCQWYEESFRLLSLLGVPRKDIIAINAENVYDTISEAKEVGKNLIKAGISSIIVTTSKSHTRRAGHIWKKLFSNQFKISIAAARDDPFSPQGWWHSGRWIKTVLSEYGAWLYYILKMHYA